MRTVCTSNIKKTAKVYSNGVLSEIRKANGAKMLMSEVAAEADRSDDDGFILLAVGAVVQVGAVVEDEIFVENPHPMMLRDRGSLVQTNFFSRR